MAEVRPPSPPAKSFALVDQVLVNVLAFLNAERIESANTALALSVLAEVTPHASKANPQIRPLIAAAHGVLAAAPDRYKPSGGMDWASACLTARGALEAFFWWRAALAYDALKPQQPEVAA